MRCLFLLIPIYFRKILTAFGIDLSEETQNDKIVKKDLERIRRIREKYQNKSNLFVRRYFIIRIHLKGIYPRIWREVQVPANLSLDVFHDKVLCPLFGYKRNFHAFMFLKPKRKEKQLSYGSSFSDSCDKGHIGHMLRVGEAMVNAQYG